MAKDNTAKYPGLGSLNSLKKASDTDRKAPKGSEEKAGRKEK